MQNTFFRFEFKYPIQESLIPRIEDDLLTLGFERDATAGQEKYYVSSIYFDTPTLSDYFDKLGGFLERKKVRARIYGKVIEGKQPDSPSIWLEIKEKYDMMIYKRRVCITPNEWNLLLESPQSAHRMALSRLSGYEKSILKEFIFLLTYQNRKPYVLIQYERKALQHWGTERPIRITLDYNIFAEKNHCFTEYPSANVSNKRAIIELKFKERLPWRFKFLLSKYNLRRDAYSKYAHGVDAVKQFYPISR